MEQESSTDGERPPVFSRAATWICLGLVAVVLGLHVQVYDHAFVAFDDDRYIYANPAVKQGLTWDGVRRVWRLTPEMHGNWHPLTWLSLMVDSQLFGAEKGKAGGYVFTNVLLHAANAVLVFLLLRQMTGRLWFPALVAAFFAVHPLRVEAVAWACQRKEVLSGLFGLITVMFYVRYARAPSLARYAAVLGSLALAMASKQTLVALPVALLLLDGWPLRRIEGWQPALGRGDDDGDSTFAVQACPPVTWQRALGEKLPMLALCAAAALVALYGVAQEGGTHSVDVLTVPVRLANATTVYGVMLWKTFWPTELAIFYPHPALVNDDVWAKLGPQAGVATLVLLAITLLVLWQANKRPYLLVGWLWYLVMMLPMSGLTQAGFHAMADRFTYIPSLGLVAMIVGLAMDLLRQVPRLRGVAMAGAVFLLICLSVLTYRQVARWQDSRTAFLHALSVTDRNYLIHYNLGVDYLESREKPGPREFAAAQRHFEAACEIYPQLARHHYNLGKVYWEQGNLRGAKRKLLETLAVEPTHAKANLDLGILLADQEQLAEATPYLLAALNAYGDDADLMARVGDVLYKQNRLSEAIEMYRRVLTQDPASTRAMKRLAWIYATAAEASFRNGKAAVRLASRAIEIEARRRVSSLNVLAAAQAEAGQFERAVETAAEALATLRRQDSPRANAMRARLALYRQRRPFHQSAGTPVTP
ncbi:MAG: hypothetical protein DWQ42_07095 [Planctomycetota bacterium]|nr:MAG: hypothetical protein DWQ42_07095 [Planctomycetota bacterium]REK38436.1 MAG: hypothetical protein DWQ46_20090 [Planctomycetota bacterium]